MTFSNALQNDWGTLLASEWSRTYFQKMLDYLQHEYTTRTIYPDLGNIYTALNLTGYEQTKVVILGQDPYHGPGQAHGLSFSVLPGTQPPPTLCNIMKELQDDIGCPIPDHGFLAPWAEQGVLLLNTVLTVREGEANSHRNIGWERFTDRVIELLNERDTPVVFILWGAQARKKVKMIDTSKHGIISSPHPSPLSAYRGFFGSRPFSRANELLRSWDIPEIHWGLASLS